MKVKNEKFLCKSPLSLWKINAASTASRDSKYCVKAAINGLIDVSTCTYKISAFVIICTKFGHGDHVKSIIAFIPDDNTLHTANFFLFMLANKLYFLMH